MVSTLLSELKSMKFNAVGDVLPTLTELVELSSVSTKFLRPDVCTRRLIESIESLY